MHSRVGFEPMRSQDNDLDHRALPPLAFVACKIQMQDLEGHSEREADICRWVRLAQERGSYSTAEFV